MPETAAARFAPKQYPPREPFFLMATDDRSDHFQPEKPHPQTKGTGGSKTTIFVVAGVAALMVVMIVTLAAPRFFGEGALRWLGTLGVAALTFAVVAGVGFMRR